MSIKEVVVNELHKPARRIYTRRKVVLKGINDLWQIDLVEMIPYAKENKGFKYLLTVIDCFSKYAWAVPVKRKAASDVTTAMESVLSQKTPRNIQSDQGKEFYNSQFKALMKKYNVNHYSTYSNVKASIVERFNRTLKSKMWKAFSMQGNYKYLDLLPRLLTEYNQTNHRTIGMSPIKALSKEKYLLTHVYSQQHGEKRKKKSKFEEGDYVRVSKSKTVFSKGYTPNWSAEIFKVDKVQNTWPYTYLLKDKQNQKIKGSFYSEELQKVKYPDVYLIEKVLRRKNKNIFVKWLGLNEKTWVKSCDLV